MLSDFGVKTEAILQWFKKPIPKGWRIVSRRTTNTYDRFLCQKIKILKERF